MSKNNEIIKITIADNSIIIRSGLAMALKRLPHLKIQPIEVLTPSALSDCFRTQMPDVLIINPAFGHYFDVAAFQEKYKGSEVKLVALVSSFTDASLLARYAESISIFDDLDTINDKIIKLLDERKEEDEEEDQDQDVLSQREKEIVVCVVKGMTNKEIAEKLFLSIHTVITHRKNITKKLQIHSASGLTIYAIVNKLVELDDVKDL